MWWLGPSLAILFAAWHYLSKTLVSGEILAVGVIVLAGFLFDSLLVALNLVDYRSGWGENALLVPLWIGGIWLGFALTVNHSFKSVFSHPVIAILLGVIGGPLTYLGAADLGAVRLTQPVMAFLALGSTWGVMMWLMSRYAVLKVRQ